MSSLLHELALHAAQRTPETHALEHGERHLTYGGFAESLQRVAAGLVGDGLGRQERVAVYLPKQFEAVLGMFGAAAAGGVFVPVNPALKPAQVGHILRDCNVRVLITSRARAASLSGELEACHDLRTLVLTDRQETDVASVAHVETIDWASLANAATAPVHRVVDADMAAILYTSGSTGSPKGVVLSHSNMVTGAHSVARYLENCASDRLLAVLPFSFDYGFSQLSTACVSGACTVLMDYLLPRDVVRAVVARGITGLAAVPPLWTQLAGLDWPDAASLTLRYITNSGGAMPGSTLEALRAALPRTRVFLMYGLTEAFRSTYLPPEEVQTRPDSIGKAIPNADIVVAREDGSPCAPGEPGELVHRGSLVALGYWNDPARTAERFRPAPGQEPALPLPEMAVWSGDTVRMDEDGYLYFIGRRDEMIKTSGYRVSPTEVEEVVYAAGGVAEAAALGMPHEVLGQEIVLVAVPAQDEPDEAALMSELKTRLPGFMVPGRVVWRASLPRNPNGKIDRKALTAELSVARPEVER